VPHSPPDNAEPRSEVSAASFFTPIVSFFRENPAIAGSLLYIQATSIGIVYSYVLYNAFNINIFDYAEVGDFLLAAFKDPSVFTMAISGVLYTALLTVIVVAREKKRFQRAERSDPENVPEDLRASANLLRIERSMGIAMVLTILLFSLGPAIFFAAIRADVLKSSQAPIVSATYSSSESESARQTTVPNLELIGTTETYTLFYDTTSRRVLVIPHAKVVSIEHPQQDPDEGVS